MIRLFLVVISLAKIINIYTLAEELGLDFYDPVWFRYSLGKGFGTRDTKKDVYAKYKKMGVRSTINKDMFVNKVLSSVNDNNYHDILGFYPGVLIFVLGDYQDKISWVSDTDYHHSKLNKCMQDLTFPVEFKDKLENLWKNLPDFNVFLDEIEKIGNSEINYESMKDVYKIQGKKAIFGILAQIFGDFPYSNVFSCHLMPNLEDFWVPEVNNLVSGCIFPVCVSPFVRNFKVSRTHNGTILQAFWHDEWWDFDIFDVGQWNLWRETLNQRRNYLKNENVLPCLVCYNWLEVTQACNYWGEDVIVRECGQDLLDSRWFRFGKGGQVAVRLENRRFSVPHSSKTLNGVKIDDNHGVDYAITTLDGRFVKQASKKDVVYTFDELSDWFELASFIE